MGKTYEFFTDGSAKIIKKIGNKPLRALCMMKNLNNLYNINLESLNHYIKDVKIIVNSLSPTRIRYGNLYTVYTQAKNSCNYETKYFLY